MSDYEILCESARALIEARPDQVVTTGVEEFLRQCEAAKQKLAESKPQAGRGRLMVELGLKIADVREGRYDVPTTAPVPEKEVGKPRLPHRDAQCPKCAEWISMLASTPKDFDCPWCKTPLRDMGVHLHVRDKDLGGVPVQADSSIAGSEPGPSASEVRESTTDSNHCRRSPDGEMTGSRGAAQKLPASSMGALPVTDPDDEPW